MIRNNVIYFFVVPALMFLASCQERSKQEHTPVLHEAIIISRTVEYVGLPAPENNIALLKVKAPKTPVDLSGKWTGNVRLYISGEITHEPMTLEFKQVNGNWQLVYTYEGEKLPVIDLQYKPPILSYTAPSNMRTVDGPLPFLAELVVTPKQIKGLYRQLADEFAGEKSYHEYDVVFKKTTD